MLAATTWTDTLTAVGTALSAVAASVAVWVAIVQPKRRRPRLKLLYPQHGRELVVADVEVTDGDRVPSAWIRLAVEAEAGRDAAEDVEIVILAITELAARTGSSLSKDDPMLSGLSLALSSSQGLSSASVPAGGYRIFDLASTYRPPSGLAPLVIEVVGHSKPIDRRNEIMWGEIAIEIAVLAKNADSSRYMIRLSYDGEWGDNIWEHLKILEIDDVTAEMRPRLDVAEFHRRQSAAGRL